MVKLKLFHISTQPPKLESDGLRSENFPESIAESLAASAHSPSSELQVYHHSLPFQRFKLNCRKSFVNAVTSIVSYARWTFQLHQEICWQRVFSCRLLNQLKTQPRSHH